MNITFQPNFRPYSKVLNEMGIIVSVHRDKRAERLGISTGFKWIDDTHVSIVPLPGSSEDFANEMYQYYVEACDSSKSPHHWVEITFHHSSYIDGCEININGDTKSISMFLETQFGRRLEAKELLYVELDPVEG